jgi:hypothetical protein
VTRQRFVRIDKGLLHHGRRYISIRRLDNQRCTCCFAGWHSYLSGEAVDAGPLDPLLGHSITYRIAVGPQAGREVFTL